jgi:molybdopterin-guanine dinucleotide biosynthesis protein A
MIPFDNITGLILAGGAGSRVGGRDKGLLPWLGKSLVAHVAERLAPQTGHLYISCNRNLDDYQDLGFPTIEDQRSGFQGPLAGIEAAREFVKTDYLAVVACDTPSLPTDLVTRLLTPLSAGGDPAPLISFAHDGQRAQYLFSVLDVRCLENLTDFLEQGQRAVKHWYKQNPHTVVDFSDQRDAFRNYNKLSHS